MATAPAAAKFRASGWSLVIAGAVVLAIGLGRSPEWSHSAFGLAVLLGMVGGLLVEATMLVFEQIDNSGRNGARLVQARPADGVVETLAMAGVSGADPPLLRSWKRFERIEPDSSAEGHAESWTCGNPALLGQVALISVFVGRDGHPWSDREIVDAHESLRSVGRWVEREAIAWSSPVNVGLADTYFRVDDDHDEAVELAFMPEGHDIGPMQADSTTKSMAGASRAAALLGFADVADLVSRINSRVPADAHVWLFHLRSRGRSHAIPAGDRVVQGVGLAICFARESSFPEPLIGVARVDPTTVAHELMHLFGASDKYGVDLADFPPKSVGRRDVMRLDETRLDRLKVGKLTAFEVGWRVEDADTKEGSRIVGSQIAKG